MREGSHLSRRFLLRHRSLAVRNLAVVVGEFVRKIERKYADVLKAWFR